MKIQKVLMPTDFSDCANAALGHALFLAEHLEADLDILHVVVLHHEDPYSAAAHFPDADAIYLKLQELASSGLERLIDDSQREQLNIREVQRRGVAAGPAIVDYARDEDVDLVVMGAHGRRGWRRWLLGSVAEEVVRTAPCAVLTLRREQAELARPKRILLPFDFSDPARFALEAGKYLAGLYGAVLEVLHVIEPPMDPGLYVPLHDRDESYDLEVLKREVGEALGREVEKSGGPDVVSTVTVLGGRAGTEIAHHAEASGADLVVIANRGLSGLDRFLLGSVTEKVVRSVECPVLTLKVPGSSGD